MSISEKKLLEYQNNFGHRLREIRTNQSLSQLDLAVMCDYEKTTISRIENGRTNITLRTALTLANALNIDIKDFF